MSMESKDYSKMLWAMALAIAVGTGLALVGESSFSSPTLGQTALTHATPLYVEVQKGDEPPVVFRLPPGATLRTVASVVDIANAHTLDLERRLRSGERIVIGEDGSVSVGIMSGSRLLALGLRIPINDATPDDLMAIPGIGERLAMKIVDFRTRNGRISSYDELLWVPGIGPKILENIKKYTVLSP